MKKKAAESKIVINYIAKKKVSDLFYMLMLVDACIMY